MDVSYGGENGFNQAIELAAESLQNVKFIQEKKLIGRYFDEISQVSCRIRVLRHFEIKNLIRMLSIFKRILANTVLEWRTLCGHWNLAL